MSTCNGKCYLSQQLKKAQEQEEKQAPTNKKELLEVVYYYATSSFDFPFYTDYFVSKLNPACDDEFNTSSFIPHVFRPPKLILI